MPDNYNILMSVTESLATHSNFCSRMPEPNNYVRHQSVDHTSIRKKTEKMRTVSATMANPAISYNADRTHLNSTSLHAVTSLIYFLSLLTTVIFHANTPNMNNSSNLSANTSKGTEANILTRSSSSIFVILEQRVCYFCCLRWNIFSFLPWRVTTSANIGLWQSFCWRLYWILFPQLLT